MTDLLIERMDDKPSISLEQRAKTLEAQQSAERNKHLAEYRDTLLQIATASTTKIPIQVLARSIGGNRAQLMAALMPEARALTTRHSDLLWQKLLVLEKGPSEGNTDMAIVLALNLARQAGDKRKIAKVVLANKDAAEKHHEWNVLGTEEGGIVATRIAQIRAEGRAVSNAYNDTQNELENRNLAANLATELKAEFPWLAVTESVTRGTDR